MADGLWIACDQFQEFRWYLQPMAFFRAAGCDFRPSLEKGPKNATNCAFFGDWLQQARGEMLELLVEILAGVGLPFAEKKLLVDEKLRRDAPW